MTDSNMPGAPEEQLFGLQVDYDSGRKLINTSKWVVFISIVYFALIVIGLLVLAVGGTAAITYLSGIYPQLAGIGSAVIGMLVVALLIMLFIAILLFRFATQIRTGIESQNQHMFNEGLKSFRNYFLVSGIFAVLGFALTAYNIISSFF